MADVDITPPHTIPTPPQTQTHNTKQTDPQEAHPLAVSPEDKAYYEGLLQAKLRDIAGTMRSTVDWGKREDPSGWPCCSPSQPDCGCDTWATYHPRGTTAVEW